MVGCLRRGMRWLLQQHRTVPNTNFPIDPKNFAARVAEALPPETAGRPIEVWFQDEARVGQQGTLTRIWAKRGSRPRKPRDRRYQWAYLFGAVCPARDIGAAVVLPSVSAEAMNIHLAEISTQVAASAHGVVVLDGAGWHQQGGRLRVPPNLTLLPLLNRPGFAGGFKP
ncbi:transposase [Siccirubricoccus deserti]